ncbi:acyltransferase family protein [Nocardioides deserti]|uniref:Acyltransferase n=1 Tax=Nocardioides deserti TaxID=1588644 RepID=A0ABR6U596_9ACTN|nr:acyltransferase family protein [Nocardioides deserti]MBC2959006.1 acyltransferase [Nocardioides deserti]GGO68999.1 acyltransferase [Nocardioides deserti]
MPPSQHPSTPVRDHGKEGHQPQRRGFRDDIQGVRALAVLAIMLYHAGLSPYPGGFVTLDVFFVVSGFLITHLLLKEVDRDGSVSLVKFYARRARRILPAASVVTVATLVASAVWLGVVEARDAATDALWTAFFAANIRFASEQTDYFAQDTAASPFQHFWSLAVEEQFYLVLPLLVVLAAWWAARRAGSMRARAAIVLGTMTAASLAWSVHASTTSPETAYFSTFTRTWEFGVGALLAIIAPWLVRPLGARDRSLLAATGLAAVVVACFTVTEETAFPGYVALLPVLGTGAIMVAGAEWSGRPPLVQRMLGIAPLRWVGDASYSLYLWHWPVFLIASQHVGRDLSLRGTAAAVLVTFALSWATYRFVETPFRTLSWSPVRTLRLYPASVGVVLAASLVAGFVVERSMVHDDAPPITIASQDEGPTGEKLSEDPAVALVQVSARAAKDGEPVPSELEPGLLDLKGDKADLGECEYGAAPWKLCRRGDTDGERTLVLLGNSHGRHWVPALEKIAERAGYRAYYLVKSACTPARVESLHPKLDEPFDECTDFNRWTLNRIARLEPDLVVVTGSAPRGIVVDGEVVKDRDEILPAMGQGFADVIADVQPYAGRVAVLGDAPKRQREPADCLGRRGATLAACADEPVDAARQVTLTARDAAQDAGVDWIDPQRWFCAGGLCPAVVGATITMRDLGHLTTAYSEQLAEPLGRALGVWGRD